MWTTLLSSLSPSEEEDHDPLEHLLGDPDGDKQTGPQELAERGQTRKSIEEALQQLPPRQREAFVLRYWEELDVAETAAAMGCSQGSVKTHCSRACHAIAAYLRRKGLEP